MKTNLIQLPNKNAPFVAATVSQTQNSNLHSCNGAAEKSMKKSAKPASDLLRKASKFKNGVSRLDTASTLLDPLANNHSPITAPPDATRTYHSTQLEIRRNLKRLRILYTVVNSARRAFRPKSFTTRGRGLVSVIEKCKISIVLCAIVGVNCCFVFVLLQKHERLLVYGVRPSPARRFRRTIGC